MAQPIQPPTVAPRNAKSLVNAITNQREDVEHYGPRTDDPAGAGDSRIRLRDADR
jgi:hypothetical protein